MGRGKPDIKMSVVISGYLSVVRCIGSVYRYVAAYSISSLS